MGKEFICVRVIVGYNGIVDSSGNYFDKNVGIIFNGDICFIVIGKDNVIDSWVFIQCIDGWEGYFNVSVKMIVLVGWKYVDLFDLGMQFFSFYGIIEGSRLDFGLIVFFCGCIIYQNIGCFMYSFVGQCKVNWWYENNQVYIVFDDKYIQEVIVLNVNMGLIGMFQQMMGVGVNVCCLINLNIKFGGFIRLDQVFVYCQVFGNDQVGQLSGLLGESIIDGNIYVDGFFGLQLVVINIDGDYIVGSIDYIGDICGQVWYMDLLCLVKGVREL